MLHAYMLACLIGILLLVIFDPVKGLGIIAGFVVVFGVQILFSSGLKNDKGKK